MARNFILEGTIEYHLQELQEALGEGISSGEYAIGEVVAELKEINLFGTLSNYLHEVAEEEIAGR